MPANVPDVTGDMDPAAARRLIELLWRHDRPQPVRPGPRSRITVDTVVSAGIERADADGLSAVTVRRIAGDIGVKPMTLYSHVPDKDTLVALMLDQCIADVWRDQPERPAAVSQATGSPPDSRFDDLAALIEVNYRWNLAHPWLIEAYTEQPPPGPGVIGKYERELGVVLRLGLCDVTTDAVLTFLLDYARSAASDTVRAQRSRLGNAEWWQAVGPVLAEVLDPARYPLAGRIGSAAGAAMGGAYDAERAYRFGRPRVLAAVAALVDKCSNVS